MKLYTEEQLEIAMAYVHAYHESDTRLKDEEILKKLTPIELPSDEEIWEEGKLVFSEKGKTIYTHYNTVPSWSDGAKWMRDKIQGGNK
jgi:hypothetical protein